MNFLQEFIGALEQLWYAHKWRKQSYGSTVKGNRVGRGRGIYGSGNLSPSMFIRVQKRKKEQ